MTLYEERVKECLEVFGLLIKSDKKMEGSELTPTDLVRFLKPKIVKVLFSDELKSEEILTWIVDAIQYCKGITDDMPNFETYWEQAP